jgi:hypothetical protein
MATGTTLFHVKQGGNHEMLMIYYYGLLVCSLLLRCRATGV